jgi:hypothetical protein
MTNRLHPTFIVPAVFGAALVVYLIAGHGAAIAASGGTMAPANATPAAAAAPNATGLSPNHPMGPGMSMPAPGTASAPNGG